MIAGQKGTGKSSLSEELKSLFHALSSDEADEIESKTESAELATSDGDRAPSESDQAHSDAESETSSDVQKAGKEEASQKAHSGNEQSTEEKEHVHAVLVSEAEVMVLRI